MPQEADELARIAAAYERRDAAAGDPGARWGDPAHARYMHDLEWELLRGVRDAGAGLGGARVLDVGCGSGYFLHRMVELGAASGTGIDLMPHRVEAGRARYPSLDLVAGSATEMPWEEGSFDVVTQLTCLSSVLDRGVRRAILGEMLRVTRPGGVVLSFDMRPATAPVRAARAVLRPAPGDTPIEPVGREEIEGGLGRRAVVARPVLLHPAAAPLVRGSRLGALLLGALPWLRSHLLVIARR